MGQVEVDSVSVNDCARLGSEELELLGRAKDLGVRGEKVNIPLTRVGALDVGVNTRDKQRNLHLDFLFLQLHFGLISGASKA